jgi:hypothetical protein
MQEISTGRFRNSDQVRLWVEEVFRVLYSPSGIKGLLRRVGASYTPVGRKPPKFDTVVRKLTVQRPELCSCPLFPDSFVSPAVLSYGFKAGPCEAQAKPSKTGRKPVADTAEVSTSLLQSPKFTRIANRNHRQSVAVPVYHHRDLRQGEILTWPSRPPRSHRRHRWPGGRGWGRRHCPACSRRRASAPTSTAGARP